jgi:hypothetical protein
LKPPTDEVMKERNGVYNPKRGKLERVEKAGD